MAPQGKEVANEMEDSTVTVVACYAETTMKVEQVWSALDIDGDGEVSEKDMAQLNLGPEAQRIWALLREDFDQDGDGIITHDEFSEGFIKQALLEKGAQLFNSRQSPALWVRGIQTQANLAIVAYAARVAGAIPGLQAKIAAAEGELPIAREDSGDMQADEAGLEGDPEEMFRAGMLSKAVRLQVSAHFAKVCDVIGSASGAQNCQLGTGDQLSVTRLRAGLHKGGHAIAIIDQICRSMAGGRISIY